MWQHLSTYGELEVADLPRDWPLLPTCNGRLLALGGGGAGLPVQMFERGDVNFLDSSEVRVK
jgi:hypothetical protein